MATALNSTAPFHYAPGASLVKLIAAIFSVRKQSNTWSTVVIGM